MNTSSNPNFAEKQSPSTTVFFADEGMREVAQTELLDAGRTAMEAATSDRESLTSTAMGYSQGATYAREALASGEAFNPMGQLVDRYSQEVLPGEFSSPRPGAERFSVGFLAGAIAEYHKGGNAQ